MDTHEMDKVLTFPDRGADITSMESEACDWFARVDCGILSTHERADFDQWLSRSPDHRAEFERARATWKDLDVLNRLAVQTVRGGAGSQPNSP